MSYFTVNIERFLKNFGMIYYATNIFCTNDVIHRCTMTSSIIPCLSILNIWRRGGLTALCRVEAGVAGKTLDPAVLKTSNNQRLRRARGERWNCSWAKTVRCENFIIEVKTTHDYVTSERRSKCAWIDCVLCIPFIVGWWKSKGMLATYTLCMCNKNLEMTAGFSSRLQ